MIMALDYDGTFTSDPVMFRELIEVMRKHGHHPIMVTQRCKKFEAEIRAVVQLPLDIVFAAGMTKEDAAALAGYKVQFWMDDAPFSVYTALTYKGCE